ncbi:uncharacterized protein LOC110701958 [Chenopodium quinoa]|uniref:uncharacterized protein LOC110701958 n=1 Tax=Chenopodium quinoa TaxID=63459 RepID=UPI000B796C53|nr:uncharacterized protein LOC110701958 [Chenopodium quinoa]
MGFDGRWVNLVMKLVSSVKYSFVINGESKVAKGDIHGVKASRRGPEISHLLFADDSLLFTRANRRECSHIVDILNQYEATSGQKINYEKSEVSFSKGIRTEQKEEILGILKMKQVERHEKYLGIQSILGRSKRGVFEALLDRVWKKLQGWKEKLLSQAGKEILLKAVIQAIPTYLMGVYKFPSETSWGLSLVMVAATRGEVYGGSKALVKEGVLWRVGNGDCINIWTDPWLCDDESRFATSAPSMELTKVSKLINFETMAWDYETLQAHFNERDLRSILAIPLSPKSPPDELIWAFSKNVMYNVKTAYMSGKGCDLDDFQ